MAHPADHPGPFAIVADLDAPELSDADVHHLHRVLRLRAGAPLTVGDGRGRWRAVRLADPLEPSGSIEVAPRPEPELCVGFALVKGDKPELVVQKLTELGIDRIVPLRARRSVVQWDEARAAKAVERLRLVARAAAMQSHRPWLPEVTDVADLRDLLGHPGVALAHRGAPVPAEGPTTVVVGPEGGWTEEELALPVPHVGLGGHVLRAETAAIAAGVLLVAARSSARVWPA